MEGIDDYIDEMEIDELERNLSSERFDTTQLNSIDSDFSDTECSDYFEHLQRFCTLSPPARRS